MKTSPATYQVDSKWKIIHANDAFCRAFRCTEQTLLGRDVRDLLREDWRPDFRSYVVRALVGVGDTDVTLPMVAPCGERGWYKHQLEPMLDDGVLTGFRASIVAHRINATSTAKPWWDCFAATAPVVWDSEYARVGR